MKKLVMLLLGLGCSYLCADPLKILHISFHKGCINDIEAVAKALELNVTSWYIHDEPHENFDGYTKGSAIYNIGHDRANRIWQKHKEYFNQFDVILTSDTVPLARIFLQNDWQKPLIIWVCNRFDYCDVASLDCHFPDPEYYRLIANAHRLPNVKIISYTPYEHFYARTKGIDIGTHTIRPLGCCEDTESFVSRIPADIRKQQTLFLYPRLEPQQVTYIQKSCKKVGISTYHGSYNGPQDLVDFKGVLYFPYAWSNLALFENLQRGIVHFVPTPAFILSQLRKERPIKHFTTQNFELCDWYCPEFKDLFVFFDSWNDLKKKVENCDYASLSKKIKERAVAHRNYTLAQWQQVFDECTQWLQNYRG